MQPCALPCRDSVEGQLQIGLYAPTPVREPQLVEGLRGGSRDIALVGNRRASKEASVNRELDTEIARWIGRLGAADVNHVRAHFALRRSLAYLRLTELVQDGMLAQHRILHNRPALYVATKRGLRRHGLVGLGPCRVSAARFEHTWQIADAAVALAANLSDWRLLSEREILWHERQRRKLLASVRVGSRGAGIAALHRPDLALLSPRGRVVAIEIELTAKEPPRLAAICSGWARARHVDAVYYLASPTAARAVSRAAKKTRAEDRLRILPLGQTAELVRLERETTEAGDDEHR